MGNDTGFVARLCLGGCVLLAGQPEHAQGLQFPTMRAVFVGLALASEGRCDSSGRAHLCFRDLRNVPPFRAMGMAPGWE